MNALGTAIIEAFPVLWNSDYDREEAGLDLIINAVKQGVLTYAELTDLIDETIGDIINQNALEWLDVEQVQRLIEFVEENGDTVPLEFKNDVYIANMKRKVEETVDFVHMLESDTIDKDRISMIKHKIHTLYDDTVAYLESIE